MNAIAGGGLLRAFPAMVFTGLPPVIANASSTVALFPGTLASTWAYRRELTGTVDIRLRWMLPASIAGGLCAARCCCCSRQSTCSTSSFRGCCCSPR